MKLVRLPAIAGLVLALGVAPRAHAQVSQEKAAQAAFDEGMELMKRHKLAEACPKLEESQRLDPGMGTAFRLAECYEGLGRLARAWDLYRAVATEAKAKNNRQRETYAKKRVEALEPKLGRMTVVVSSAIADTPGLTVTRDGEPVTRASWGASTHVDPGEHTLRATAPGRKPWETRTAAIAPGTSLDVVIPALEDERASAAPPPSPPAAHRSAAPAIVMGSVAAVGIGLGVAGMVIAAGKRGTAGDLQTSLGGGSSACAGASPPAACAALESAWGSAQTFQNLGLWSFVGAGLATAGTLVYVLWPAPKAQPATGLSVRVVPTVGAGTSGVLVSGTF
ncbi:Hypothetical protein A7982_10709 [Minicystis rosea]|nr:Hypothetical protein A7982_10709 [Minicystis rosea]